MFKKILIVTGTMLFAASALAQSTPGHQMQKAKETGKRSTGPGASEYTPGHKMQHAKNTRAKSTGPGASEYAPGHQTTTGIATTTKRN